MHLRWGADPGLHPGLVELALQAEIAAGSGQWAVRSERIVEPGAVQLDEVAHVQHTGGSHFEAVASRSRHSSGPAVGRQNWCHRCNCWRRCFRLYRLHRCKSFCCEPMGVLSWARFRGTVAASSAWGSLEITRAVRNLRDAGTTGIDKFPNCIPAAGKVRSGLTGTGTRRTHRDIFSSILPLLRITNRRIPQRQPSP